MLSDEGILSAIHHDYIKIDPEPEWETALGSCSVDLRLANDVTVWHQTGIRFERTRYKNFGTAPSVLPYLAPGDFALAHTVERVTLTDQYVAHLGGKSRHARRGLAVHITSTLIDPGFDGVIVLELKNLGPSSIALIPEMYICSLTFTKLYTPTTLPYYERGNYIRQSHHLSEEELGNAHK